MSVHVPPTPNFYERALATVAPKRAQASFAARMAFYQVGQYTGARHNKTATQAWRPFAGSADSDSIGDLATLRARSRDLTRNAGIARGAMRTSKVNVVGAGLRVKSEIKRDLLGMSVEDAEAWESKAETLFDLWASSKTSDLTQVQSFYEQQGLAFTSVFESGDAFLLRRFKERGSFLGLCVQLVEADRCSTPVDKIVDPYFRDGVQIDGEDGTPVNYWILNVHPGDILFNTTMLTPQSWKPIPAVGPASGQSLILHLFERERIGLSRGIPALAAVMEDLKQLDRYSEAELMAAVVSAFFTVFIKSANGTPTDIIGEQMPNHFGPRPVGANEVALGSGSIVELGAGESIETANAARPNANFDPFFLAIVRKIGVSLGIPYEVLIQHFSSSYSASRAALEVAWQHFMDRRIWLANNLCQPVYEWFLYECVARGLLVAPGFMDDPIRRAAWCGAEWIGPARIVLDPMKEANAEDAWINMGVKTLEQVTINQTGGKWKPNQTQRGRERKVRIAEDLEPETPPSVESSTGRPLSTPSSAPAAKPSKGKK